MKTRRQHVKAVIAALSGLMLSTHASAATQYCTGTILGVYIVPNGDVTIQTSWRNDYVRLCSLKGTLGGVDTVTCSMWTSLVAQAIKEKAITITMYYDAPACNLIPIYDAAPVPGYFMLRTPQG